jgi:hypothetical protein
MKKTVVLLCAAALAASTGVAQAQGFDEPPPPPPSGVGLIVTGAIFTGIGGVNLITSPICLAADGGTRTLCLGVSLGIGIGATIIGIPMLAVGVSRRKAYVEWKRRGGVARLLDLDMKPVPGGGAITWQAAF